MTTGTFSQRAKDYIANLDDDYKIELIDQDYLMDIMLRKTHGPHGFGMHETQDYKWLYMNPIMLLAVGAKATS